MKILPSSRIRCGLLAVSIVFLLQTAHATTTIVEVGQGGARSFTPDSVSIQPGDTVEWDWVSGFHSATSGTPGIPDGTFDSGVQSVPFTFSFTFPTAGTFPYYCTVHGAMMVGTVNVVAPSPTPSPTSTPTSTPNQTPMPITVSGTISYCSNPVPGPVPNVTLNLTGDTTASTLSDGSGNYMFSSLVAGGSYIVTPTKAALAPASAGINTVDVLAVQRHFLNIALLTGCRMTAADVNGDTLISTADVIAIQRFALGFATGIANTGKYQFAPASRSYPGVVTNQTAQNYDALVFGDVASTFVH